MTWDELTIECEYRRTERLGMLCEDREPTWLERHMADQDVVEWRKWYEGCHVIEP